VATEVRVLADPQVQEFLRKGPWKQVDFDVCMFGLRSIHWDAQHGDVRIKKPWTVWTTSPELVDALSRRCDGEHTHAPCAGNDTKVSESYTPKLAKAVHAAFKKSVNERTAPAAPAILACPSQSPAFGALAGPAGGVRRRCSDLRRAAAVPFDRGG